jgi:RND family efflux transporter MFP subunit
MEKPPMPIPEVVVETPQIRDVRPYIATTGTTKAFQFVEIPARVTGFLREIRYTPGEIVPAGAPLFLIQPEQYQAEVKAAEGSLAAAHAQLKLADANLDRTKRVATQGAATQEDLDTASAQRDEAAATVTQAEAAVEKAKLNLSYTDVRSPIRGKVDRNLVDLGNMVAPIGSSTILTTVAGMDPIYVYFDISDSQFNSIRVFAKEHKDPAVAELDKQLQTAEEAATSQPSGGLKIAFELSLIKGSEPGTEEYPFKGLIDMASNTIDSSTGTITIRGKIPNADYGIFPGQICRIRIPLWPIPDAVLVKEEAIGTDLHHQYIYVVDEKNVVHRRVVELGISQADGTRVVTKGLEKDERYVVEGIQKIRDGAEVKIAEPQVEK